MRNHHRMFSLTVLGLVLGCDPAAPDEDITEVRAETGEAPLPPSTAVARPSPPEAAKRAEHHAKLRTEPLPEAERSFHEVVKIIGKHYVDGPLPADVLWTGAIEGVLARLIQLEHHPINVLLGPAELAELKIGTHGQLVGVGVAIERVADVIVIREVLDDSPAAMAGLRAGDRILAVNGERIGGLDLAAVVARIRGEDGSTVDLFVQRDTDEWTVAVKRGRIAYSSVEHKSLDDGIGYVRINAFSESTVKDVETGLAVLGTAGMSALVLDLRGCPGGLVEPSIEVAERLLPPGRRIVSIRHADGREDVFDAKDDDRWDALPVVVLIDEGTASGAEILAAALAEHGRAPLVGTPTTGKGTVESLYELDHGWALKLTTSRWASPSGQAHHGVPLTPDIAIPATGESRRRLEELAPGNDPQLAGAIQLLRRR